MKRVVNGVEVDLSSAIDGVVVERGQDRLSVKTPEGTNSALAIRDGDATLISYLGRTFTITRTRSTAGAAGAKSGEIKAPMPGQVVDVLVREGESVEKGAKLLVLEAMKVQQPYLAPFEGTVAKLPVSKGQQVNEGALLIVVEPVGVPS